MRRQLTKSSLSLGAVILLAAGTLAAQRTGTDTVAGYAPSAGADTAAAAARLASTDPWVLGGSIALPGRSADEVEQAQRTADLALARSDTELARVIDRRARTAELIRARQRQLAEIEAKKNQADKEKRNADKQALDSEKKVVERQKALAEELQGVNDAEIAAAREAREAAIARQQAIVLERMLVEKRSQRAELARSDRAAAERTEPVIRELERQTLVAQKKAAGAERDLAGKREFAASKRLDLYRSYIEARGLEE
jgi:hypothetical protein